MNKNTFVYKNYHINSKNYPSQIKFAPGEPYKQDNYGKIHPRTHNDIHPDSIEKRKDIVFSSTKFSSNPLEKKIMFTILNRSYLLSKTNRLKAYSPSAGGLYPIELYIIILNVKDVKRGIYHYNRLNGGLYFINTLKEGKELFPNVNEFVQNASFIVIFTAEMTNLIKKYGSRGYRYALIECGHIGQNLSIECLKQGVGCCPIGGFYDDQVNEVLNLFEEEISLYIYSVGCLE